MHIFYKLFYIVSIRLHLTFYFLYLLPLHSFLLCILDVHLSKNNHTISLNELYLDDLLKEYNEKQLKKSDIYTSIKIPDEEQKDYELEGLEFYNEFGGFDNNGKEYKFCFDKNVKINAISDKIKLQILLRRNLICQER